jgi:preprotein translocase subunit SecG
MLNIVISLLTFVLIIISLFMVLVILMQRASSNSGMGSAFGGGVAESAFGAETTNILTRATKWSAFTFFAIALTLYLLYMARVTGDAQGMESDLPVIPDETTSFLDEPVPSEDVAGALAESVQVETTEMETAVAEGMETVADEAAEVESTVTEAVEDSGILPETTEEPVPAGG